MGKGKFRLYPNSKDICERFFKAENLFVEFTFSRGTVEIKILKKADELERTKLITNLGVEADSEERKKVDGAPAFVTSCTEKQSKLREMKEELERGRILYKNISTGLTNLLCSDGFPKLSADSKDRSVDTYFAVETGNIVDYVALFGYRFLLDIISKHLDMPIINRHSSEKFLVPLKEVISALDTVAIQCKSIGERDFDSSFSMTSNAGAGAGVGSISSRSYMPSGRDSTLEYSLKAPSNTSLTVRQGDYDTNRVSCYHPFLKVLYDAILLHSEEGDDSYSYGKSLDSSTYGYEKLCWSKHILSEYFTSDMAKKIGVPYETISYAVFPDNKKGRINLVFNIQNLILSQMESLKENILILYGKIEGHRDSSVDGYTTISDFHARFSTIKEAIENYTNPVGSSYITRERISSYENGVISAENLQAEIEGLYQLGAAAIKELMNTRSQLKNVYNGSTDINSVEEFPMRKRFHALLAENQRKIYDIQRGSIKKELELNKQIGNMLRKQLDLHKQLKALRRELKNSRDKNSLYKTENVSLNAKIELLNAELMESNVNIDRLKKELNRIKVELDKALSIAINHVRANNSHMRKLLDSYRENEDLKESLTASTNKVSTLADEINLVKQRLDSTSDKLQEQLRLNDILQEQYTRSLTEIESLKLQLAKDTLDHSRAGHRVSSELHSITSRVLSDHSYPGSVFSKTSSGCSTNSEPESLLEGIKYSKSSTSMPPYTPSRNNKSKSSSPKIGAKVAPGHNKDTYTDCSEASFQGKDFWDMVLAGITGRVKKSTRWFAFLESQQSAMAVFVKNKKPKKLCPAVVTIQTGHQDSHRTNTMYRHTHNLRVEAEQGEHGPIKVTCPITNSYEREDKDIIQEIVTAVFVIRQEKIKLNRKEYIQDDVPITIISGGDREIAVSMTLRFIGLGIPSEDIYFSKHDGYSKREEQNIIKEAEQINYAQKQSMHSSRPSMV